MEISLKMAINTLKLISPHHRQPLMSCDSSIRIREKHVMHCIPVQQQMAVDSGTMIMCESCGGRGWLLCDFCNGKKTNVQVDNNRIYRRCPSCKAIGSVLCSKCKVYRCVTFPDSSDGEELKF